MNEAGNNIFNTYERLDSVRKTILMSVNEKSSKNIKKSVAFNMAKYLKKSKLGDFLDFCNILLSLMFTFARSVVLNDKPLMLFFTSGAVFFAMHYALEFYTAEQKIYFFISFRTAIEAMTIMLPVIYWSHFDQHLTFIMTICPVMRVIVIYKTEKLLLRYVNNIAPHLFRITHTFASLTIIMAALIYYVEGNDPETHYFNWIYFMIVTVALVGFGDLYPKTNIGQALVILSLFIVLVKLPSDLLRLQKAKSFLPRTASETSIQKRWSARPFVLVIGLEQLESAKKFLKEFYHKDHGRSKTYCIFMMTSVNPEKVLALKRSFEYSYLISFVEADPTLESNLAKIKAEEAQKILVSNESGNKNTDDQNILYYIALRTYLNKKDLRLKPGHTRDQIDYDEFSTGNLFIYLFDGRNQNYVLFLEIIMKKSSLVLG